MKTFQFYWLDGKYEDGEGATPYEAFRKLGYGAGVFDVLDYYEEL